MTDEHGLEDMEIGGVISIPTWQPVVFLVGMMVAGGMAGWGIGWALIAAGKWVAGLF